MIRGGAVNRVVVALGNEQYRSQPVDIGIESGDRVEIRGGLSATDRVVSSGQFLIDSESSFETSLMRLEQSDKTAPDQADRTDDAMDHSHHREEPAP